MFRKKHIFTIFSIVLLSLFAMVLFAADDVTTYLIMNDIPPYKRLTQAFDAYTDKLKTIPGYTSHSGAGVITGADHFIVDHPDVTYETTYQNDTLGVAVEVTKHSGSDSDKWLLHELDAAFRDQYGIPSKAYTPRLVDGQTIMVDAVGGRNYRWVSGSKVIMIEYHGSLRTMPEPIEVVQAYLAKHPSMLPAVTLQELRSTANKTSWIKDEMDRRLWLCDKWFYQLQLGKVQQNQVYQEVVKSMNIFLDYREKYYGIKAADEKNLLAGYLNANNGTGIKAKLTEYKNWWSVNKDKAISL